MEVACLVDDDFLVEEDFLVETAFLELVLFLVDFAVVFLELDLGLVVVLRVDAGFLVETETFLEETLCAVEEGL